MPSSPHDRPRLRLVDARIATELAAWNRPGAASGAVRQYQARWERLTPRPEQVRDARAQLLTIVARGADDAHDLPRLGRPHDRGPADWRLEWSPRHAPALAEAAPRATASAVVRHGRLQTEDVSWRELVQQLRRRIRFATQSHAQGPRFVVVGHPRQTAVQLAAG